MSGDTSAGAKGWITRGVIGIVVATFFSDVGHEMVTAVLPFISEASDLARLLSV